MRIGLDLVDVARLRRTVEKHPTFAPRAFTPVELSLAEELPEPRRYEFLAGRFAAKEAALKALGTGLSGGVAFTEIEIGTTASGEPAMRLGGEALKAAAQRELTRCETSITHDAGLAAAVVVLT